MVPYPVVVVSGDPLDTHPLAHPEEYRGKFVFLPITEGSFEELIRRYGVVDKHVQHVAVGFVRDPAPSCFLHPRMDLPDGVNGMVSPVCLREYDLPGIRHRRKQPADGVGGKLAGEIQPVNRFVEREFRSRARENEEHRFSASPNFADDRVFIDESIHRRNLPKVKISAGLLYLKKNSMHRRPYLKLDSSDNVIVALQTLSAGTVAEIEGKKVSLAEDIPAKHKFFEADLPEGAEITMYGVLVGKTLLGVKAGSLMTVANTAHAAGPYSYRNRQITWNPPDAGRFAGRTFMGYHRSDGRVGTANYWLFIPSVFCENRNLDVIREALHNELGYAVTGRYKRFTRELVKAVREGRDPEAVHDVSLNPADVSERIFEHVDGIKFLNHQGGCGGTRQDSATLNALLAAYADHPNVAGITLFSLGCQHIQSEDFIAEVKRRNPSFDKPLLVFEQQTSQSEESLITEAIRKTFEGLMEANRQERTPAPLSKLCVGVKCGGSDGFSGISANPAVGHTSDLLVALGARVLLAEFPELCGAEQDLVDRCVSGETANKFIRLMKSYDEMAHMVGSGFHMNPSPGNIRDGLITDAIKSAGAVRKGGSSPVVDVLDYTEPAIRPGLSLVCTPGNDVEATTGKAASGATIILFTTGLGTPTGNPVSPTIKIATNSTLARRMGDIIDIDTGPIVTGEKTIEEMGEEILEFTIKVASGEIVPKAVQLNQDDFIPWKRGVSL